VEGRNLDGILRVLYRLNHGNVFEGFDFEAMKAVFRNVFRLSRQPNLFNEITMHADIARLLAILFKGVSAKFGDSEESLKIPERIYRCLARLNLDYDQPLNIPQLAGLAGVSISHFFRLFKEAVGMSPNHWLRQERINQAKQRLLVTDEPIARVAEQTGYCDQFYFSHAFKQITGISPSEYRRRARQRTHRPARSGGNHIFSMNQPVLACRTSRRRNKKSS
jgi:AraC-like DNA-binding protein